MGEVIRLYEDVLKNTRGPHYPVDPEIQHRCFQHICTSALHEINRRDPKLKNHALGFAHAAHRLLRHSLSPSGGGGRRVRQYAQVYISISTGDKEWIYKEIRELLDAGIYVLDAPTSAPRTKRATSDPIQQFILTYRKLFGLSTLIGLSYRDRFELSGRDLEAWLREPEKAEDILIRNQTEVGNETDPEDAGVLSTASEMQSPISEVQQLSLLTPREPLSRAALASQRSGIDTLGVKIERINRDGLANASIFVGGLGFEERCEGSLRRLSTDAHFGHAVMLKYTEPGRAVAIKKLLKAKGVAIATIERRQLASWSLAQDTGEVVLDISGLSKPAIFHFAKEILRQRGTMIICHTAAREYFPSEADIEPILRANEEENMAAVLDGVGRIFNGEDRPYTCDQLLKDDSDEFRPRALLAFSSAKHERLLTLIEDRYYDFVGIAYSSAKHGRAKISEIAARFAVRNFNGASCYPVSSLDPAENIEFVSRMYFELYHTSGYNVEIGLTGSKMSALAAGIVAAKWKISQAWYVRPKQFNTERFTSGVGSTRLWRISVK